MKKLIFVFTLMISTVFISCGGNTTSSTESTDTIVDTTCVDSVDTVCLN